VRLIILKNVLCSDDVVANVDHLHVNRIHLEPLVDHFYIVRDDYTQFLKPIIELIAMKSKETYCTKKSKETNFLDPIGKRI
jgi:hypothetical protein